MRRSLPIPLTLALVLTVAGTAQALPMLHASSGKHAAIRDQHGRQLILRGANVTALQDNYQVNPWLAASAPLTDADLAQMRSLGFNVIRLAISWSALEPKRGQINQAYLRRIKQTVAQAASHGIYTIIDMHNDGWSKYIYSRGPCSKGSIPVQGYDGAPKWASLTGGASACLDIERQGKLSPAVRAAWDNFWRNKEHIRSALVKTWGKLARALAHNPAVAGYDLLNAPLTVGSKQLKALGSFYGQCIQSIRLAEKRVHGFSHMVFFNPNLNWSSNPPLSEHSPTPGFTKDHNIVFSAHIYAGANGGGENPLSLTERLLRRQTDQVKARAKQYKTAVWVAEWGFASGTLAGLDKIRLEARVLDRLQWGNSWWQWKVSCGNPTLFSGPDDLRPLHFAGNLNPLSCPNGTPLPSPSGWKQVLARPYPMASPGSLSQLSSSPTGDKMTLAGSRPRRGSKTLVAWVPNKQVTVSGARATKTRPAAGGTIVQATVGQFYRLSFQGR